MAPDSPSGRRVPGVITLLPAGGILTLRGEAMLDSMVEVLCEGASYAVFREDLSKKSSAVQAA